MTDAPRVVSRVPAHVAVVRRRVRRADLGRVVPELCGHVWDTLRQAGLTGGRHVAIYRNDAIDLEVGVEVETPIRAIGDVVPSTTPAGEAVCAVHLGPYSELGRTHARIAAWCVANRYPPTGVRWEIYGHWQPAWNADPSAIRTDVFHQVTRG